MRCAFPRRSSVASSVRALCVALVSIGSLLCSQTPAYGEPAVIELPKRHTAYRVELEPHALLGFGPFEDGALGLGMRGSIVLMDPGFVTTVNDSVAISFGADVFLGRRASNTVYVPVQMQWNFFFTKHWSMMLEPGLGLSFNDRSRLYLALSVGGRYQFSDRVALTFRLGYPALSVGLSFLL
jgi:hypothetical protein